MLGRLRAIPGVQGVSLATEIPIGGRSWVTPLSVEGRPETGGEHPLMELNLVGADYFRVMGIPVLTGRAFTDSDARPEGMGVQKEQRDWAGMRTIILDEQFARRQFPDQDPIGKQIRLPWGERDQNPVMTVVGVVGRVTLATLREDSAKAMPIGYVPYRERPNRYPAFVVKTALPSDTFARAAREQLAAVDPSLPLYEVRTLSQMRAANIAPDRLNMTLLATAALIALSLAIIGIYGVVAFSVAQRHREIGVRLALGAQRRDILSLVLGQGMKRVGLGVVLGLVGAFGFSRVLAGLLFQIEATDLPTLVAVATILMAAAALACAVPARRAARLDPMESLRN